MMTIIVVSFLLNSPFVLNMVSKYIVILTDSEEVIEDSGSADDLQKFVNSIYLYIVG